MNINIEKNIAEALSKLNIEMAIADIILEIPDDLSNGNFSTNVAMRLASQEKKNPRELAQNIVNELPENEYVEKVEIAGPGFINFFVNDKYLEESLKEVLEAKDFKLDNKKGKTVVLEYTDPNPFKIFHIGHLYTNCVGESFSRLQEALGADVKRACYQGDVGLHVAKTLWGLQNKMNEEIMTFDELSNENLLDRIKYLGDAYILGTHHYDNLSDPEEVQEIDDLNYYIFSLSISSLEKKDFSKYEEVNIEKMYWEGRDWCLEYFESIYERVGTKYDYYFFETEVGEAGLEVVKEFTGTVFKQDGPSVIYEGDPKKGLHTRVFINKYGVPTYEGKEIGLFQAKKERIGDYDESIIMTGDEQSGYFKVVLDAFSKIDPDTAKNTSHLSHGMVKLPGAKKMSSRAGSIIAGDELLDANKQAVKEKMLETGRVAEEKVEELSEKISIAAMKYSFLKVGIGNDVIYDINESISFEGNTGPYLMYVYARCNSLLNDSNFELQSVPIVETGSEEASVRGLVLEISKYRGVVLDSALAYQPSILCNYLFNLGKAFNHFYQEVRILDAKEEQKALLLSVVFATKKIMADGLNILGIPVVEEM
jgi:arginyl-tRNA synthetase